MKKMIFWVACFMLFVQSFAYGQLAEGREFKVGTLYYRVLPDRSTVKVIHHSTYSLLSWDSISIPEWVEYDGYRYTVTEIGRTAFAGCDIVSVTIPNTITLIDTLAFDCCHELKSIVIPDGVTEIKGWAFEFCDKLESIEIGKNVSNIEKLILYGCKNLQTIIWNAENCGGDGFEAYGSIPSWLYNTNTDLMKHVVIGTTCKNIPERFMQNYAGLEDVVIKGSIEHIGKLAFSNCSNLKSVDMQGTYVSVIEDYAFSTCKNLAMVNFSPKVDTIKLRAFTDCKLDKIHLRNCTYIGREAFYSNWEVKYIIIDGVKTIEYEAFDQSYDVRIVKLGKDIKRIEKYAFKYSSLIDTLYCMADVPPAVGDSILYYHYKNPEHLIVYVPCGKAKAYKNADYWKKFTIREWCESADPIKDEKIIIPPLAVITMLDSGTVYQGTSITYNARIKGHVDNTGEVRFQRRPATTDEWITWNNDPKKVYEDNYSVRKETIERYIPLSDEYFVRAYMLVRYSSDYNKHIDRWDTVFSNEILLKHDSGIEDINEENMITVYPNPAKDIVTIEAIAQIGKAVRVFDNQGRVVFEDQKADIRHYVLNTALWARGIYYIEIDGKRSRLILE